MKHRAALWMIVLIALAWALRLGALNTPIWGDEAISWYMANRNSLPLMLAVSHGDPSPPLYYAALHITIKGFGDSAFGMRFASAMFGVLIVPLSYQLVRVCKGTHTQGVWGALLSACSSVLVFYSQEARSYSLLALLGILATYLLVRTSRQSGFAWQLAYACTMAAMSLTHRYSVFLVAAHAISILVLYRSRRFVLPMAVCVLCGLAFLAPVLSGAFTSGGSGQQSNADSLLELVYTFGAGTIGMQHITAMPLPELLAFPVATVDTPLRVVGGGAFLIAALTGAFLWARRADPARRNVACLALCACIPVGLAWLAGSPLSPVPQWLQRGLVYVWPIAFAFIAVTATARAAGRVAITIMLIANALSFVPYYGRYLRFGEGQALESLQHLLSPGDLVVADPYYWHAMLRYYVRTPMTIAGFDSDYGSGWIDVDKMNRTNAPWLGPFEPLTTLPKVSGRIFVYARKDDLRWASAYPGTPIFQYDLATRTWRQTH